MMFTPQLNAAGLLDASVQRMVTANVAGGADPEARFALAYEAALDLCEQHCEAAISGSWLDPVIEDDDALAVAEFSGPGIPCVLNAASGGNRQRTPIATVEETWRERLHGYGLTPLAKVASELQSNSSDRESTAMMANPVSVKSQLAHWMDAHALVRSTHHCAMYCRRGMEAVGLTTGDRPQSGDAGDYGPFLLRHGAQVVPLEAYTPQVGDTVVFDKTDQHPNGHIEIYDGRQWVSDFMQRSFSPYRDAGSTPPFTIYRLT